MEAKVKKNTATVKATPAPAKVHAEEANDNGPDETVEKGGNVSKEEATPAPAAVKVASKDRKHEYVKINVLKTFDPSPRIGNFSFAREKNITKLVPGVYEVPRFVAEVLVDSKSAQIVE